MAYTTIDDPSAYFQTKIYTGTGSSNAITNDGNSDLQPDWIWGKARNQTYNHNVFDTSRGLDKRLTADQADAENTDSTTITAVGSDGFTLGTSANLNGSSVNYVAWQWKANGGTTSSNTDGSITSTVQADTTAGFSIVTYTGTGSAATIGHGLGSTPKVIITKDRDALENWVVHHHKLGATFILRMDQNDAKVDASSYNDTLPTSTVFSVEAGGSINQNTNKYVSYCFAEKQGYSKFGSFTGNGSTDGPFVYTGFKPAWLMYKEDESAGGWGIWDNKRVTYNPINIRLLANTNAADDTSNDNRQDFLSNGFKVRNSSGGFNESGRTIYYMAFAEHPFVSSEGVPTTAR